VNTEVKFFSSCEPVKPDGFLKYSGEVAIKQTLSFRKDNSEGRNE
jgi:hypothetical protein